MSLEDEAQAASSEAAADWVATEEDAPCVHGTLFSFKPAEGTTVHDALAALCAREQAGYSACLARVACGTGGDEEVFGEILRDVKILEDVTGQVDFWWVVREKTASWGLPPEFVRHADDHHQAACGRMVGWLEARAWIDHRYLPDEGDVRLRVHRMGRALAAQAAPLGRPLPSGIDWHAPLAHAPLAHSDALAHGRPLPRPAPPAAG